MDEAAGMTGERVVSVASVTGADGEGCTAVADAAWGSDTDCIKPPGTTGDSKDRFVADTEWEGVCTELVSAVDRAGIAKVDINVSVTTCLVTSE